LHSLQGHYDISYSKKYTSSRQTDIRPLNSQNLTVGFAKIVALCVVKPCTMVGLCDFWEDVLPIT